MALDAGTQLGIYEITGQLGAGGMGEVYRATDTKLGREVAIKTLPAALAFDEDRLARFEREAKLLAALNHAHIASVYGLDEHEGTQYLAMELVEGETLETKLKAGALPVEDALRLALHIAEALEAAHEKGVVHRDLKPANIMLTLAGQVKVLDFGLAKALTGPTGEASPLHSPALSLAMTQAGLVLGTAGYMSPEQASGQATDQRADVWAFGVVLYEMLTGLPLFSGESVPHILAAVLQTEPDWKRLPKNLHPRIRQMLERCLEKKPRNRYHSIADARVDIERVLSDPEGVTPRVTAQNAIAPRPIVARLAATFVVGAVLAGALTWTLKPAPTPAPMLVNRFEYVLPPDQTLRFTNNLVMALSPDGRNLVYNTEEGLYLRSMDALEGRPIAGTEEELINPVFSPDGQWVAYLARSGIKRIALRGGAPVVIANGVQSFAAGWSADGTIFYNGREGIFRVPASGGAPERIIEQDPEERSSRPELLPDGDSLLFAVHRNDGGNWGPGQIVVQSPTGERTVVLESGTDPRYVPTGHLVYTVGDSLHAVGFDPAALKVSGAPVSLVQGIMQSGDSPPRSNYGIARDGTLAYVVGTAVAELKIPVWVDREGNETPLDVEPRGYGYPRLSPDGSRLAWVTRDGRDDIWVYDLARAVLTRLTVGAEGLAPVWSPDGSRLAYGIDDDIAVVWQPADGSAGPSVIAGTAVADGEVGVYPRGITPDGGRLLLSNRNDSGPSGRDISMLILDDQSEVQPLIATPAEETTPAISPNGRWLAYDSDESGQFEIYVRPFPDIGRSRIQVSSDGGRDPVWSRDGRELFYWVDPGTVMGVAVEAEEAFSAGRPSVLVQGDYVRNTGASPQYEVSADGQRFLMIKPAVATDEAAPAKIVIVQNFFEELERLVPTE